MKLPRLRRPQPGDRVTMRAPYGALQRGETARTARGAWIIVQNGAAGRVVGRAARGAALVVTFDDIGPSVEITVPEHWLAPADAGDDSDISHSGGR